MKNSLLIFLIAIVQASASIATHGQNVTLVSENQTMREVFKQIETETNYRFFYNEEFRDLSKVLSLNVNDFHINEVLDAVLANSNVTYKILENNLVVITPHHENYQEVRVTGRILDSSTGEPLPGASIVVQGTTIGTTTGIDGEYSISVPGRDVVLVFSFIGYLSREILVGENNVINVSLEEDIRLLDEIVVVGYGVQRRSDITGTVASLPQERLEMVPNLNIAQAIQGSIPGVMVQTTSAGARSSQAIMIRGRNSILADNTPLIVVDGIPYGGQLNDINPNDVASIEVLKDASAAAIYGSRGSNGVILISTREGSEGVTRLTYDGKYSIQSYTNLPNIMDGAQFYEFKTFRPDGTMTPSEQAVYDSGQWVDWLELGMRNGYSQQHSLGVSGGFQNTKYYISGNFLDVQGLIVNDDYRRLSGRINVDTKVADWLTIGTRTGLSHSDMSGVTPSISGLFWTNPLATAYDENGNLTITPIADDPVRSNPLESTLYDNINRSNQVVSNNFVIVDFPFVEGLSYRLNTGIRWTFADQATYRGRNTRTGLNVGGSANTNRTNSNNTIIENVLSFNREIGSHNIFATGVVSWEENNWSSNSASATGFPHDFLSWYAAAQANVGIPNYGYNQTDLISQMLRLNYSYDSRYLLTISARRDGFSGFGEKSKWGIFPSVGFGWNIHEEQFFPLEGLFNEFKLRASYGLNGNQAVTAYRSISRLSAENTVVLGNTVPGYKPSVLGSDNLGWESSSTLNLGLDIRMLNNRIAGSINMYHTNTSDLLLNRTISPVHGITSITQNIGKTENRGFEFDLSSRNIVGGNFRWNTSGNFALVQNKIVSLYGELNEEGNEIDDISNSWFIGKPIRVNFYYEFDGIWQNNEAEEAARYGSQPGYVKLRDVDGDGAISGDDRQIIGQQDPKLLWGLTNSFSYRSFSLDIFIHGVHGVTQRNELREEHVTAGVRQNTTYKDWWTPTNPTNIYHMNYDDARRMSGIIAQYYEDASFIRVKDLSISFNMPSTLIDGIGIDRLRLYVTGRNLFTFTKWGGLDPELPSSVTIPLQKEFVFGLDLGF